METLDVVRKRLRSHLICPDTVAQERLELSRTRPAELKPAVASNYTTAPWGDRGKSNPRLKIHNLACDTNYTTVTVRRRGFAPRFPANQAGALLLY